LRYASLIVLLAALLISGCGNQQQASNAPTAAAPAGAAGTEVPALLDGSVPEPSPTPGGESATSGALPATATAQLILPPATEAPTQAAPPTPTESKPAAAASQPATSRPVRLVVRAIGVDQPIVSVGLDQNRVPIVPRHNVGWYNLSAEPGQGENIVLWGHVLPFRSEPKIPPPFARLKELKPGAKVTLYDTAGNAHAYVVTRQVLVRPDQVEYILPVGSERLTMVSCIGDKVIANGSVVDMTRRLITIAEPES